MLRSTSDMHHQGACNGKTACNWRLAQLWLAHLCGTDRVFALAGLVVTPAGLVLPPVLEEAKAPIVGMFTCAQGLREPLNRNGFLVRAIYNDETDLIVAHLHDTLDQKMIARSIRMTPTAKPVWPA